MTRKKKRNNIIEPSIFPRQIPSLSPCPVHKLVGKQTFSLEEMEWHLAHKEEICICNDCAYFFQKEINKRIKQDRNIRY